MDGILDQVASALISHGPLGLLSLVSLCANWVLFRMYSEAQENRIREARENQTAIQQLTSVITALREDFAPRRGRG